MKEICDIADLYGEIFRRNIGFLTESEQEALEKLVDMLLGENEPVIIRDLTTDPRSRPGEPP